MSIETIRSITAYVSTDCSGSRHGATQEAYRHGCRHAEAVAAHENWVKTGKGRITIPAQVAADGSCTALRHGSNLAWLEGCRHPEAVAAHEKAVARKEDADRVRRDREYARMNEARARRCYRMTGGRIYRDPRAPYRGGKMLVDRNNLRHFLAGYPDSPTVGEMIAAIARLETRTVPDSAFLPRLILPMEIAARLKLESDRQVYRIREARKRLRNNRTKRRLADVLWKQAVADHARTAKPERRALHEAAAKRRAERGTLPAG